MRIKRQTNVFWKKEKLRSKETVMKYKKIRNQARSAVKNIEKNYLVLAETLSEVQNNGYYISWGYDNFKQYLAKDLNMSYRRARYLIEIWSTILVYNLPKNEVIAIGWTKMRYIARVINDKNKEEWFRMAKEKTAYELQSIVQIHLLNNKKHVVRLCKHMGITCTLKEYNTITEAISSIKSVTDLKRRGAILASLCQIWLNTQDNQYQSKVA
jgi:hypothetical protein